MHSRVLSDSALPVATAPTWQFELGQQLKDLNFYHQYII